MTKIKELTDFLEEIAPLRLQEDYDNSGLITGSPEDTITGVLCTLDTTPEVVQEAIDSGLNVIVSHHPLIFRGLKKISGKDYVTRALVKAVKHDIAIYAIHTNLDKVLDRGVNEKIADRLGLQDLRILDPEKEDDRTGSGAIGRLSSPLSWPDFLKKIKRDFELEVFRYTETAHVREVQTVAVCGGSGSFLLQKAMENKADVFITADYKYHQFFEAEDRICILDIGHYESEKYTIQLLNEIISKKFINFAAQSTNINTNPVRFFK